MFICFGPPSADALVDSLFRIGGRTEIGSITGKSLAGVCEADQVRILQKKHPKHLMRNHFAALLFSFDLVNSQKFDLDTPRNRRDGRSTGPRVSAIAKESEIS
jgi:hypothetical protein